MTILGIWEVLYGLNLWNQLVLALNPAMEKSVFTCAYREME